MPSNQSMFGFPSFIQYPFYRQNPTPTYNQPDPRPRSDMKSDQHSTNFGHIYPYRRKRPEYTRERVKEDLRVDHERSSHRPNPNSAPPPNPPRQVPNSRPSNPFFHMNPGFLPNMFGNSNHKKEPEPNLEPEPEPEIKDDRHGDIKEEPDYIFEIMGIKLDMGDIMIVLLLYFLYKEGVEDQTLFFSLIFLLLS